MQTLTEKTFFYYLKCPKWLHHARLSEQQLDALEHRMIDDGLLPAMQSSLLSVRGEYEEVNDEDVDDAFNRTVDLMRQGVRTIYGGVLVDGHWVGRPDVLERVEGKSTFGDYYYVAVDIKRISDPRQIRDGHKMQGAFYAELLERIQEVQPTSGYIMSSEGVVMRYDLESFEADYRLNLARIEAILAGEEPGHILTSGCKASPFFTVCVDEAKDCDDLSLLNRIHGEEIEALNVAGIKTVFDLASANVNALQASVIEVSEDRIAFLHRQAVALKERVHHVVEPVTFPESNVEIYFDIEADPTRDLDYLFGVLRVETLPDGSVNEVYTAFSAEKEEEDRAAWEAFAAFLADNPHAPVYHYGWYEIGVCAKLIERWGAPEAMLDVWRENFIDLNAVLRPAIIFPLSFYSLKDIAQYLGFSWRSEDAGGVNSIRWYHDWLATGDRTFFEKIRQYNEDDVRATKHLKDWLQEQKR